MILLDTHALIWLDEGNARLGKKALKKIDESLKDAKLFVATISYWEIAMLLKKERIKMSIPLETWRANLVSNGLQEIQLSANIAIQSAQLESFHGDSSDRMITATALFTNTTLCTANRELLNWGQGLSVLNANS